VREFPKSAHGDFRASALNSFLFFVFPLEGLDLFVMTKMRNIHGEWMTSIEKTLQKFQLGMKLKLFI
jgi:hypothetical protein